MRADMTIWVDADALPGPIREILFRAAKRTGLPLLLVANRPLRVPTAENIEMIVVPPGLDVADSEIAARVVEGDLVITNDIPLASDVIDEGALALSPRGTLHTSENIRARLTMRDFMDTMRASGIDTGGPPAMQATDHSQFANQLDRLITKFLRRRDRQQRQG